MDLAREANVTRQTIIAIEKGRLNPSITLVLAIARALDVPVEDLFFLAPCDAVTPEPLETSPEEPAFQTAVSTGEFDSGMSPGTLPEDAASEEEPPGAVWDFV
jgi:putative transcriptional regulator